MRTMETVVYQFDELNDRAKDRARDWFRSIMDDDFGADCVLEDAARIGKILGININTRPVKLMGGGTRMDPNVYYSVGNRDSGCTFAGSYEYVKGNRKALESEAPSVYNGKPVASNLILHDIARRLQDVQSHNFYRLTASINHGPSRSWRLDIDVDRTDNYAPLHEDIETVEECLQDFANWIEKSLETEYEYRYSDECVDESIRANEYEFDEDGKRV